MAIVETPVASIVVLVGEGPELQQREVLVPAAPADACVLDFTIWSTDSKRVAEFRIARAHWDEFKAFGDAALEAFDKASAEPAAAKD